MGQINCHCQYITTDDFSTFKNHSNKLPILTQQSEIAHIHTKITLKNAHRIVEIPLVESRRTSFGTSEDCEHRPELSQGNGFKFTLRYSNRCAFVRDCGVGLGVFIMKKKVVKRAGSSNLLLNIGDKWVYLKIMHSEQINFCVYDEQKSQAGVLEPKDEHEIDLGVEKLVIRKDRQAREYSIRRQDRREMWVLLGEERRVKAKDLLRLGFELFEVESISSYLQASKVLRKY